MTSQRQHTFHIPVMGIAFTIDSPARVAHFGISSVVSIIEDELLERMRAVLSREHSLEYVPVSGDEHDCRAKRITAYLDLLQDVVDSNVSKLRREEFTEGSDISRYFGMLPDTVPEKAEFRKLSTLTGGEYVEAASRLRNMIRPGAIDVNIMTKVDKTNYDNSGQALPAEFSDALSALRGFANSKLSSSVVFSAGLNPRLYSYCEKFADFFPDKEGRLKKKIILKVSDYRSALIQGKFLAKKGLWISEFRIESGLNCGGHAFATDGLLLGPILEEFKEKRAALQQELFSACSAALKTKGVAFAGEPSIALTVQGGIGTAAENQFLMEYYGVDSTGWGSPFLLVPEATTVDAQTLARLSVARQSDYYLSHSSPLGIPFNNFRPSSSEEQRLKRIQKNRPGSPCYKKFLVSNTEFTEKPICTASREYQNLKIKHARAQFTEEHLYQQEVGRITEKDCLCEGLGSAALLANNEPPFHKLSAVAICPGPNLAYFSGVFRLSEMVDHIYGRVNILNSLFRPHMFVNELTLYVNYLKNELQRHTTINARQLSHFTSFRENLLEGISYYMNRMAVIQKAEDLRSEMRQQLVEVRERLEAVWAAHQQNGIPAV